MDISLRQKMFGLAAAALGVAACGGSNPPAADPLQRRARGGIDHLHRNGDLEHHGDAGSSGRCTGPRARRRGCPRRRGCAGGTDRRRHPRCGNRSQAGRDADEKEEVGQRSCVRSRLVRRQEVRDR